MYGYSDYFTIWANISSINLTLFTLIYILEIKLSFKFFISTYIRMD